jgi:hypothetical protein
LKSDFIEKQTDTLTSRYPMNSFHTQEDESPLLLVFLLLYPSLLADYPPQYPWSCLSVLVCVCHWRKKNGFFGVETLISTTLVSNLSFSVLVDLRV